MKRSITHVLLGLALHSPSWGQDLLRVDNPARTPTTGTSLDFSAGAFVADDMVPVQHFDDTPWPENYHSRSGDNLGLGSLRADFSGSERGWTLGYFYRQDWLLRANQDTVDAYALAKRDGLSGLDRTFNLDYDIRGINADGLKLGYAWSHALSGNRGLVFGASVSLLRGQDVRLETARGSLVSLIGSATLNGSRRMYNSTLEAVTNASGFNDFSPPAAMDVPHGWGFGLDFGLRYYAANGATVAMAVNDLAGRIRWDRVPVIVQDYNNAQEPYQPGGADPAISGSNTYESLTLRLKPKYLLEGEFPTGKTRFMLRLEGTDGQWFPQLGLNYALTPQWQVGVDYETRFGAVGISLRHPNLFLALSSQAVDLSQSRAMGLSAGLHLAF